VDTVQLTVQYGMAGNVSVQPSYPTNAPAFYPTALVIGVGGTVRFFNGTSAPFTLTFLNDLDHIDGSVTDLGPFSTQVVRFLAVGTYQYKDPVSGATGSIIVREQPTS
jgi:plastocyanin